MADVGERKTLLCAQALLTLELQTLVGDVACFLLGVENVERVTGCRAPFRPRMMAGSAGPALSMRLLRSLNMALIRP